MLPAVLPTTFSQDLQDDFKIHVVSSNKFQEIFNTKIFFLKILLRLKILLDHLNESSHENQIGVDKIKNWICLSVGVFMFFSFYGAWLKINLVVSSLSRFHCF